MFNLNSRSCSGTNSSSTNSSSYQCYYYKPLDTSDVRSKITTETDKGKLLFDEKAN
jgi:hypothetical protein